MNCPDSIARQQEREAIVKWLRRAPSEVFGTGFTASGVAIADAIERGEHGTMTNVEI